MDFKPAQRRRKPPASFFLFSMNARDLRLLSGIQRRGASEGPRSDDTGIQRAHDQARSSEIGRFVANGYPWSRLRDVDRKSHDFDDLRKPGWLPTAIVVNILTPKDSRRGEKVSPDDQIDVDAGEACGRVLLPQGFDRKWRPSQLHPIEVIDGQHRLWSFDDGFEEAFQLPVVAFYGLDISWQAYLFWTINIMPTKINPSLAFDLYPLLRSEDWLERTEGPRVYREARAQELTEVLWSHPESPWLRRINMLGQTKGLGVTQAGWIRSLMATFFRQSATRNAPGGLYASTLPTTKQPLPWSRTQQSAFLVFLWQSLSNAVESSRADWASFLRSSESAGDRDPAFYGNQTYLNTEQGVRAVLTMVNDLTFVHANELSLDEWQPSVTERGTDAKAVSEEMKSVIAQPVASWITTLAEVLAEYDWRGADAPGLDDDERALKRAYRGSGGYAEFRRQLLKHVARHSVGRLKTSANELERKIKPRR